MASRTPKNIFIIGAQCTGKTTLLNALKAHYSHHGAENAQRPGIISEVARTTLRQLDINRDDIASDPEKSFLLQRSILQAQYEAEQSFNDEHDRWYISDRSGLDPIVYTRLFVGEEASVNLLASPQWAFLESNMRRGSVLLCEAGCPWLADDGTRLMPRDDEDWRRVDSAFRQLLEQRDISYIVVPCDLAGIDDRVKLVVAAQD